MLNHKESKQGNFVFNGERKGPMGKHEDQQRILHQHGLYEHIRIESHRKIIETQLFGKNCVALFCEKQLY